MKATEHRLTIDALAQRTGMTVRNIRAHQSRGLLPGPELVGRTGFYGPAHIERIELIRGLQDEGFNLTAISRVIENSNGSSDHLLRFAQSLRAPFESEQPSLVTLEELASRWGPDVDPSLLRRALEIGILRQVSSDTFEEPSPLIGRASRELTSLGIPAAVALDVAAEIRSHAQGVADSYVRLFLEHVWRPFDEAGRPSERWPEIRDALERLRPLASDSLVAIFGIVMTEAVERAFGEQVGSLPDSTP